MSTSREATAKAEASPEWLRAMQERMALATPQDTARGLFFNSILEAVRSLGDEAALARCQAELGDQQPVAFFNYPVTLLLRLTAVAAQELSGRYGGAEPALKALGHKATGDFLCSPVGNAVRMVAGKDVKQLLSSVQSIYRMTTSYGERSVGWLGPKKGRLFIRHAFMPLPYHEGVLEELLLRYGSKDVWVSGQQVAPLDAMYDFSWE
jgi:uncharacterized protein (TIGR02265 family)